MTEVFPAYKRIREIYAIKVKVQQLEKVIDVACFSLSYIHIKIEMIEKLRDGLLSTFAFLVSRKFSTPKEIRGLSYD